MDGEGGAVGAVRVGQRRVVVGVQPWGGHGVIVGVEGGMGGEGGMDMGGGHGDMRAHGGDAGKGGTQVTLKNVGGKLGGVPISCPAPLRPAPPFYKPRPL